MNYYIVIPAHNEEAFISLTLQSLTQTHLPKKSCGQRQSLIKQIVLAFAKTIRLSH
jgi:hypothetical protein